MFDAVPLVDWLACYHSFVLQCHWWLSAQVLVSCGLIYVVCLPSEV